MRCQRYCFALRAISDEPWSRRLVWTTRSSRYHIWLAALCPPGAAGSCLGRHGCGRHYDPAVPVVADAGVTMTPRSA
jgi:hypothetical protein